MKRRAVGGNILPMTKSRLHFFSFGTSCKPTRRGKNNHLMTFARVFVVGVYLAGAQGMSSSHIKTGWKKKERNKILRWWVHSGLSWLGNPKVFFFFNAWRTRRSRKEMPFSLFREQPTALVLIEYLLAREQKKKESTEKSLLSRQNTHTYVHTHRNCKRS